MIETEGVRLALEATELATRAFTPQYFYDELQVFFFYGRSIQNKTQNKLTHVIVKLARNSIELLFFVFFFGFFWGFFFFCFGGDVQLTVETGAI